MSYRQIQALGGEGILNASDLEDFSESEVRIAHMMADKCWHGGGEIRLAAGKFEYEASEGLRRFRSVRQALEPKGYHFERKRASDGRNFVYRMTPPPAKETLF